MRHKVLNKSGAQRTLAVVLETGEEAMACLSALAKEHRISAAQITGIGAFSEVVLKYFDWERKEYVDNPVGEQAEVASLMGTWPWIPQGSLPSTSIWWSAGATGRPWPDIWDRAWCAQGSRSSSRRARHICARNTILKADWQ